MASPKRFFKKSKLKEQSVGKTAEKAREKTKSHVKIKPKNAKKEIPEVQEEIISEKKSLHKKPEIVAKKPQLPNIPRVISEQIKKVPVSLPKVLLGTRKIVLSVSGLIILGVIVWEGFGVFRQTQLFMGVMQKRLSMQKELSLWENIAQRYPTYRDAYYQAAVLAYRLGEREKEQEYLQKVLALDPNFTPAQNLQKMSQ